MPPVLKLTFNGTERVLGTLGKLKNNAQSLRPAFKAAAGLVVESVNRNFMEGGRPTRWKELSPITMKRRRGSTSEILRDTGVLMASIGQPNQHGIMAFTPLSVTVGTNVIYARAHQEGIGVPKREFMMLQEEDVTNITKIFNEHMMKGVE